MIERLRLIVYLTPESKCSVFERMVDFDSSVSVPFESLRNDMRFLFGKSCKIVFELCFIMKKRFVYSFVEVDIFPPQECRFYQLFKNGVALPFVYSESSLDKVFSNLYSHDWKK